MATEDPVSQPSEPAPTPALALTRLTTDFIEDEDRIRIAAETTDGQTVVLWFTQRLLLRLVPQLVKWLEPDAPGADAAHQRAQHLAQHGFAQDAARARLGAEPPVAAKAARLQTRVDAVDVSLSSTRLQLVFRGPDLPQGARLTMEPQPLRQWLAILHDRWVRAQWPLQVWPAWMAGAQAPASDARLDGLRLH